MIRILALLAALCILLTGMCCAAAENAEWWKNTIVAFVSIHIVWKISKTQ